MTEVVALAWSGGKDCTQALAQLTASPDVRICALVATLGEENKRLSMHGIREDLLERQAAALGFPLVKAWLPAPADNDTYRERFAAALKPLIVEGLERVAFGDIALADVRAFREEQMEALGLAAQFPLWGESTASLARGFIANGHQAVICCVDTQQLEANFLGRRYDETLLADLPPDVDPCGENGEFHSFVYGGPLFDHALALEPGQRHVSRERFHFLDFRPAPRGASHPRKE
ncbi:MAG: adenine nucleotide alpha hydrolase [Gammaproteobacteria bacterium]|nr:adenine nucleotide alpha hydrolase [Gammaproteobacteria bacterium]